MPAADLSGPTRRDPSLLWIVVAILLAARISISIYEEFHPPKRSAMGPHSLRESRSVVSPS